MAYNRRPRKPIYDATTGEPPTEVELAKMETQARNVAEYWLGQSSRSRKEIKDKILKKGIIPEVADKVLDHYQELGYIDDNSFAEQFVYSKTTYGKLGKRSIGYKLKEKGISEEIIEEVLSHIDEDEENAQALELALKKARSNRKVETHKRVQQIVGLLVRRGYSGNIAFQVAKQAVLEEPAYEEEAEEVEGYTFPDENS